MTHWSVDVSSVCSSLGLVSLFIFFSLCPPPPCPLSTSTCPTCLTLSPSATHLSAMWTCGSLPGMYPPIIFLCFPPFLLFLNSVQAGGAPLNRLVVSRGITCQRRGFSGTAYRQTVSRENPVSPTLSHDPVLLLSVAAHLAHDLAHTRPHTPWHNLTWIFLTKSHGIQIHFLCVCVRACTESISAHTLMHIYTWKCNRKCKWSHMTLSTEEYRRPLFKMHFPMNNGDLREFFCIPLLLQWLQTNLL